MPLLPAVVIETYMYPFGLTLAFDDALVEVLVLYPIFDKFLELRHFSVGRGNVCGVSDTMYAVLYAPNCGVEGVVPEA